MGRPAADICSRSNKRIYLVVDNNCCAYKISCSILFRKNMQVFFKRKHNSWLWYDSPRRVLPDYTYDRQTGWCDSRKCLRCNVFDDSGNHNIDTTVITDCSRKTARRSAEEVEHLLLTFSKHLIMTRKKVIK